MRVLVTGASGFIGRHLRAALERSGHAVVAASRGSGDMTWDPMAGPLPAADVQAVVHLAGENVGKHRWTRARMQAIRDSRWIGTRHLVQGIARWPAKPKVLFCASAVGYYGDRGDDLLGEEEPAGSDFLAVVCKEWEEEAARVEEAGVRRVSGRIGLVLGAGDGALAAMLAPFKLFLGGPLGSGEQWMSWVHVQDVCGLILRALEDESMRGPVNVTAPAPVKNKDFSRALGAALGRPSWLRTPYAVLRVVVGKFAPHLVSSQRCVSSAREYRFQFPDLDSALRDCISPK